MHMEPTIIYEADTKDFTIIRLKSFCKDPFGDSGYRFYNYETFEKAKSFLLHIAKSRIEDAEIELNKLRLDLEKVENIKEEYDF